MKLKVVNIEGKETSKSVELKDSVFGVEPNDHAIYLAVKQFLANQRQGTHKTKERAEVTGSTRKIKRQKGTGTARAGSIKNPIFRGGGRVFGPKPHKYGFKLNKKVKDLARKSALSYKSKDNAIVVVEDFNLEKPATKEFFRILTNLGADEKKSVMLMPEKNENIYLSSRNISNASVSLATGLNTYDIMNAQLLILTEGSVKKIEEIFN